MPDRPPEPLTPAVPTTVTCPKCGVDVAVGYPRCPRCHAAVPQGARARRATPLELGGGTSVEVARGPSRAGLILLALAGVVLIVVIVLFATGGGGSRKAAAPEEAVEEEAVEDETGDEPADEADTEEEAARPEPAADPMPAALRDLDRALRAAQLWSNVRREGTVVVVESALCEDTGMWPAIAALAGDLRDAGASAVRCQGRHGGVIFERAL
jgi:hypothetical protein